MLSRKKKEESMNEKNVAAFNAIYVEHSLVLRKLAVNYGVPYREVEDIVQDAFLAYYSHYALDMEAKKMKALLTRILKNKCIDYLRRNKKIEISLGIETLEENSRMLKVFSTQDTLSIVLEQEESERFWKAMKDMRSDWQKVFYMYFMQGYPIKEVGEILGITEQACRTRISRGRKYLKAVMDKK